jgi:hypothetical protein
MPVWRAVLLALLLGPFGVAFTSPAAAIFTGFVTLVLGLFTYGSAIPPVFAFCAILVFIIAPRAQPEDRSDIE